MDYAEARLQAATKKELRKELDKKASADYFRAYGEDRLQAATKQAISKDKEFDLHFRAEKARAQAKIEAQRKADIEAVKSPIRKKFEKAGVNTVSKLNKFLSSKRKKYKATLKSQQATVNLNQIRANTQRTLAKGQIGSIHFKKEWDADKRELFFS